MLPKNFWHQTKIYFQLFQVFCYQFLCFFLLTREPKQNFKKSFVKQFISFLYGTKKQKRNIIIFNLKKQKNNAVVLMAFDQKLIAQLVKKSFFISLKIDVAKLSFK